MGSSDITVRRPDHPIEFSAPDLLRAHLHFCYIFKFIKPKVIYQTYTSENHYVNPDPSVCSTTHSDVCHGRESMIGQCAAPTRRPVFAEFRNVPFAHACYTGFPLQELNAPDPDYGNDRTKAVTCNTEDGIKPITQAEQEFERKLNWQVIKRVTMAIFKADVSRFSFPVGYSEWRTFMERACDLFAFPVSGFLEHASEFRDPAERLSWTTIGIIASFHLYCQSKKPWNPVIGETFIGRWANGVTISGEQVSHHPPITAMQLRTPTNHWKIDAQFSFGIDQGIFKIDLLQKGLS
jgi:hypothetical protein